MIRTIVQDIIPVSLATAFEFVAEMRNLDSWGVGVRAVQQTTGNGPGPGASYECTMFSAHFGPKTIYRMAQLTPGRSIEMEGSTSFFDFKDTYLFEPVDGGAQDGGVQVWIIDELTLKSGGVLAETIMKPLMGVQIARDLENLKGALIDIGPLVSPKPAVAALK